MTIGCSGATVTIGSPAIPGWTRSTAGTVETNLAEEPTRTICSAGAVATFLQETKGRTDFTADLEPTVSFSTKSCSIIQEIRQYYSILGTPSHCLPRIPNLPRRLRTISLASTTLVMVTVTSSTCRELTRTLTVIRIPISMRDSSSSGPGPPVVCYERCGLLRKEPTRSSTENTYAPYAADFKNHHHIAYTELDFVL